LVWLSASAGIAFSMSNTAGGRVLGRHTTVVFAVYLAVIALGIAGAVAIGAGRAGGAPDAAVVVERFLAAVDADDAAVACGLLTETAAGELEKQSGTSCDQAVLQLPVTGSQVARVEFAELSAVARVSDGPDAFLDKTRAGWRISAAGCEPRQGEPYECELEG
jgi:hypothetical protein